MAEATSAESGEVGRSGAAAGPTGGLSQPPDGAVHPDHFASLVYHQSHVVVTLHGASIEVSALLTVDKKSSTYLLK